MTKSVKARLVRMGYLGEAYLPSEGKGQATTRRRGFDSREYRGEIRHSPSIHLPANDGIGRHEASYRMTTRNYSESPRQKVSNNGRVIADAIPFLFCIHSAFDGGGAGYADTLGCA